jgi:beta-glucosidase
MRKCVLLTRKVIRTSRYAALALSLSAMVGCQVADRGDTAKSGTNAWPSARSPLANDATLEAEVESLLSRMTLEEKVGQIMQAEIQAVTPEDIKQYHIGSVLNGGGSMPYRIDNAQPKDWVALADEFYQASMDASDGGVAIPIIWGSDAVHGHNNVTGATIFPHNIGLGAARNPELIQEIGKATAREVRATGIEWVFAPTLAVAQNDRWGRTYESYSEDPALVARYAVAMVEGLQGKADSENFLDQERVVATAKHFLADGGTEAGDDQGSARISEQELVDIHNPGYPAAIDAGVQTIMASFSSWNGEKMHGNRYLLTDVLKERMGFDGFVVGDWNGHGQLPGCTNDSCPQAFNAGIDMFMVTHDWKPMIENTLAQVRAGDIPVERLDDAVRRILRVKLRAGLFEEKPSERMLAGQADVLGHPAHRAIARQAVRESLVLLKNKNRILPLNPQQNILVAGKGANDIGQQSGGWSITWQGTGTTNEDFPGATSIFEGIRSAVEASGGNATLSEDGSYQQAPDVAIVVFGEEPYAEGNGDRDSLEFEPGDKESLALLQKLREAGIPTVSVFLSGRPLWVNPELNASDAFVAAWLPGSEGSGIADVLIAGSSGEPRYDFQGTLSFSWPKTPLQDVLNPHHPNYDPLFPLGYGLTYKSKQEGPGRLPEQVEGVATGEAGDINLYVRRPMSPRHVFINNGQRTQILSGAFASLPEGDVVIQTTDKDVQEDALSFTWNNADVAGVTIEGGEPLDLAMHLQKGGAIAFDVNVENASDGATTLSLKCGQNCERNADLGAYFESIEGKGWQHLVVPLACMAKPGDTLEQVSLPFSLQTTGTGQLDFANIRFLLSVEQEDIGCPVAGG